MYLCSSVFFFQAEDGIRALYVTGVQTCALPISNAARTAGFTDVTSANGDAGDLARLVAQRFAGSGARLIYLRGRETAGDLAGVLARDGLRVESVAIYAANAVRQFPAPAEAALRAGCIDGVLHFSRR